MNKDFHLANLTDEKQSKIDHLEKELNVVLIAWEPYQSETTKTEK